MNYCGSPYLAPTWTAMSTRLLDRSYLLLVVYIIRVRTIKLLSHFLQNKTRYQVSICEMSTNCQSYA